MPNFRDPKNRHVLPPRYATMAKSFVASVRSNYDQTNSTAEGRLETMLQSAWVAGYDAAMADKEKE